MRCYFTHGGHITGVEFLRVSSDGDAIEQALHLFGPRDGRYRGFEVWACERLVYRYPSGDRVQSSLRMDKERGSPWRGLSIHGEPQ
jgi:hypothetical protein